MTCPRCHAPVPPNALFCANCGNSFQSGGGKKSFALGILAALAIVGLGAAGLLASGLLRFRAPAGPVGPQARAPEVAPPQAMAPPETPGMPDDIRDWLEHLRKTEEKRMDLAGSQIMSLMVSMQEIQGSELTNALTGLLGDPLDNDPKEAPSVTKAKEVVSDVRPQWQELSTFFESKPPPEACKGIAGDYDQTLRETAATVSDVLDIVNNVGDDPHGAVEKLRAITNNHKEHIDKPAARADEGVQRICDQYHVRKWFSIKGDVSGGGLFAAPTIPMPGSGF